MYCRYTQFTYDPDDRGSVQTFWNEIGGPVAAGQDGFQGGLILDSLENEGIIRALTLWNDPTDFDAFSSGAEHQPIVDGIRSTSLSSQDRDGLGVMQTVEPIADEVRVIRCQLNDGCADGLRDFWRSTGRAIVEGAPGCMKAEALLDVVAAEVVIAFHWRSADAAEAFRNSAVHNEEFVPAIERFVTPIARLHTESL